VRRSRYQIFPPHPPDRHDALAQSIQDDEAETATVWDDEGNLLDGWERESICEAHGLCCPREDPHRAETPRAVYNAVGDWASALAGDFVGYQVRTLRRLFFNRPGALYETPEALVVRLDRFAGQEALTPVIDAFNAAGHRLPWLENRKVVVSLTPEDQPRSGP
jgi:hypothetical protein